MKRIYGILLVSLCVFYAFGQSITSDSLYSIGVDLYQQGKYKEAIPLFTESNRLDISELDTTNVRRNYSAMWLASCYYLMGDTAQAKAIYEFHYDQPPIDRRLTVLSDHLNMIGKRFASNGDYTSALKYYLQCSEIEKDVLGDTHRFYLNSLETIGYYYYLSGDSILGRHYYQEYLSASEKKNGKVSLSHAINLAYFAKTFIEHNDIDEAINLETQSVTIFEQLLNIEENRDYLENYAIVLHNLSVHYITFKKEYEKALHYEEQSLEIWEKLFGKENEEYILRLRWISACNLQFKKKEGFEQAKQIMDLTETLYSKCSSEHVEAVCNYYVEIVYNLMHDYPNAVKGLIECMKTLEDSTAYKYSPQMLRVLDDLALIYRAGGDHKNAVQIYKKALDISTKVSNVTDDWKITTQIHLSDALYYLHEYDEAISVLQEVGKLETTNHGENTEINVTILNNLAFIMSKQSKYLEGIEVRKKALVMHEKLFGKNIEYAILLALLAEDYNRIRDTINYKRLIESVISITESYNQDSLNYSWDYFKILRFLGGYYLHESPEKAEVYIRKALELYNNHTGYLEFDPGGAELLRAHSQIYWARGDKQKALEIREEVLKQLSNNGKNEITEEYASNLMGYSYMLALSGYKIDAINAAINANNIYSQLFGEDSEETMSACSQLAALYYSKKDYGRTAFQVIRLMNHLPLVIRKKFGMMTSRDRTLFWDTFKYEFEDLIPRIIYKNNHPDVLETVYNSGLLSKGLLLSTEMEMKDILKESNDDEGITLLEELQNLEQQIAASISNQKLREHTDSLRSEMVRVEGELLEKSKLYGDFTKNMTITWKDVQRCLGDKDMAIEFVYFPVEGDSLPINAGYGALLLKKNYDHPLWVPCVGIKPGSALNKPERNIYNTKWMTQAVWGRYYDELQTVDNIYFAPAGELHNIAIESLVDLQDSTKRMSERWNFYRLSSTRQLVIDKNKRPIKTASVYGGLVYNTDTTTMARNSNKYPHRLRGNISLAINSIDSLLMQRGGFDYLPATKDEAVNISKELKKKKIIDSLYVGSDGSEESFKTQSGKNINLMHIATHGFYWTEKEAYNYNDLSFLDWGNNTTTPMEDKALTRSGLLLSGAQNALKGKKLPTNVEDGILTAKEISQLDLRGLDLVTLSACQTGLGDITGEGVFGLQRGFKKAGANTILMSLWKVDDKATQMLMTQFYKNLMSGKSKYESLRQAQSYVMNYEVERNLSDQKRHRLNANARQQQMLDKKDNQLHIEKIKPYKDPKYWAAFILLDAIN